MEWVRGGVERENVVGMVLSMVREWSMEEW